MKDFFSNPLVIAITASLVVSTAGFVVNMTRVESRLNNMESQMISRKDLVQLGVIIAELKVKADYSNREILRLRDKQILCKGE